MKLRHLHPAVYFSLLLVSALVFLGCEVGSSDSASRTVGFDVTGYYRNDDPKVNYGRVVGNNTGAAITTLDLRQSGDQLSANDNNGLLWSGSIGDGGDFQMSGRTTAGNEGTMAGTIEVSGDSATMRGTYIEASLYSTIYAQATVPTNAIGFTLTVTVDPDGAGSVDPSGGDYTEGAVVTLTASANEGFEFSSWEGASGTGTTATVTMTADMSVIAKFVASTNGGS